MLERPQPPHNLEAEQALLGALLAQNAALEKVAFLAAEHFHQPVHGRVFEAIVRMIESGRVANPVTLKHHFEQDGSLVEIGGASYLARLAASVVTVFNADDYGRAILECWQRRELMRLADDLLVDAATVSLERSIAGIIDDAERLLCDLSDKRPGNTGKAVAISAALSAALDQAVAAHKAGNGITGIPTGLLDLDRTLGGLQRKNLVILAGRPSMGKTALATTIAANAAKSGLPVAFFSLEMPKEQIAQRLIAGLTGISSDRQARGELDQNDFDRMIRVSDMIGSWPLIIDDTGSLGASQIRQRARRIKRRHGLGLIIVDHLQKMRQGKRTENRRLEIGEITGTLADVAKELDVAVLLLSQLSRAVEQRDDKRPMLADLRESGDIEQDADVVMFCYRDEYYLERAEPKPTGTEKQEQFAEKRSNWLDRMENAKGKAEIIIAKNRQGPVRSLEAAFLGERSRFENLARR